MNRSLLLSPLPLIFALALAGRGHAVEADSARNLLPLPHESHFDFGHVGIDFSVFHTYFLVNRTGSPLRIIDAVPHCQCTKVVALDSIVGPSDSARFRLSFNSRDFYGPVQKTFSIETDHPRFDNLTYSFTSVVGQWFDGIKPEPVSLFFLPAHQSKKIRIQNNMWAKISLTGLLKFDNSFQINELSSSARKGDAIELEVRPDPELEPGTYLSSMTMLIEKEGSSKPTVLTIPIKVVRY